ncbi:MAG: hypothetical protein NC102_03360 [Clostridium sp.]|nr:hypothetical protein [Clostridium sp.]
MAKTSPSAYTPLAIPQVEAVVSEDKVNCVQYGRVQNLIEAATNLSYVLQKLQNHPSIGKGRINGAYVALAGRSLGSEQTSAELPLPHEMEITGDILKHLLAVATKPISGDKKVIKVVPRKYYVDNQATANPVGALGTKIRGEFTVVTCSPTNQRNLELVLNERLHLPVKEYVPTPLTTAAMVLGEEEKQLGCALVDVGAQTTTVSIYKDRALQRLATIPIGSYNITHDIAMGCNTTDEHAEGMKLSFGNALPDSAANDDAMAMNCYVQARVGEIIANIMAQIEYAGYKASDLSAGFIVAGRGAKLKNFTAALEAQTKMKARLASVPDTVAVKDASVEPSDYISLMSILSYASAKPGDDTCVDFPPKPVYEDIPLEQEGGASGFDPYESGRDDENLLLDDEELELRRAQAAQRRQKEQDRLSAEEERRSKKAKQEAEKKAAKEAKEAEELRRKQEKERNRKERRSILSMMRDKFTEFVGGDDEDDSTDLDQ